MLSSGVERNNTHPSIFIKMNYFRTYFLQRVNLYFSFKKCDSCFGGKILTRFKTNVGPITQV